MKDSSDNPYQTVFLNSLHSISQMICGIVIDR